VVVDMTAAGAGKSELSALLGGDCAVRSCDGCGHAAVRGHTHLLWVEIERVHGLSLGTATKHRPRSASRGVRELVRVASGRQVCADAASALRGARQRDGRGEFTRHIVL
jgi:hypothetical protein